MNSQTSSKKKKSCISESQNFKHLDFIIAEPKQTKKNELYLFSPEVSSLENIVYSTKPNAMHTMVVIRQSNITSLKGISELVNLRELWVVECLVKDLSDLRECRKIEKLYLYSNNISQVPNMSNSPRLKLLSLNGNNISNLQNFHSMPNLEELYIANNKIKKIDNAFSQNYRLSHINLAGNPLYDLKDIKNLSFITSLRSIALADSMYGECPLVSLCNYRYYIVNYLTGLIELDYYPISNEERSNKTMFYNMLCKTYVNDFTKSCKDRFKGSRKIISEYRKEIYLAKLEQLRIAGETSRELFFDEILHQVYHRIDANDASDREWMNMSRINLQILQQQLSLKVLHSGNMDFVEYLPGVGNKLFEICQDICDDSLCRTMRENLGITSIRVHRVTKVINNESDGLRFYMYYKEAQSQDKKIPDSVFKFLVRPIGVVELQKWPFGIFEQQFFDTTEILISDCLAAADSEWLKRISSDRKSSQTSSSSSSQHRLAILVQLPVSEPTLKVESPDNYHAMYPDYDKDTCRCLSILEPEQVKPVFAVEYEYIFENESEKEGIFDAKFCSKVAATNPLNTWPCLNLENLESFLGFANLEIHKLRVLNLSGRGICRIDFNTLLPNLRELCLSYNKLTALPDSVMLKYVRKLDVSFNDIELFAIATSLPSLESLDAAWNLAEELIPTLQMLKTFTPNLTRLNLKHNPFGDVTETESACLLARDVMPLLKFFNDNIVTKNVIYSKPLDRCPWAIDIFEMADLPKLKKTRNSTVQSFISKNNNSLTSPLSFDEKELGNVEYINLSNNYLSRIEFLQEFSQLMELYLENNLLVKIFIEKPLHRLTKLNLSGNFISMLDGLTQENLPVINHLDLCNNLITSLKSLASFHTLTQFYCSYNKIAKLEDIHTLKNWHGLKMIDLSNNPMESIALCNKFIIFHISRIEYVSGECVTASDRLEANHTFGGSLDKDTIMNMCHSGDLTHLNHLSIVNCALKKVNLTTDLLPNLKSLDLSKNEITTLWGLHTLKKLQVLCLNHNQVKTSLPNFREDLITPECLFPSLNTVYLDYNGIPSLLDLNLQNIPKLKYLYLQHNELQDVNGLQKCVNLEIIVLDNNRIQMLTEEDFHPENKITTLFLENNKIKYLSFAKRLKKINKLFISNNKIANKEQLKYLGNLENLKEITILGNPLCKRTNHYKLTIQALATLTHIDGHSMILNEYFDTP